MNKLLVINELLRYLEIPISVLEKEIGLSNNTLVRAMKNKQPFSDNIIYKIIKRYPEINELKLRTGEGSLLSTLSASDNSAKQSDNQEYVKYIVEIDELRKQLKEMEFREQTHYRTIAALHDQILELKKNRERAASYRQDTTAHKSERKTQNAHHN